MEEILASIRRIISEDEAPADTAAAAEAEPAVEAAPEPQPDAPVEAAPVAAAAPEPVAETAPTDDDVLELTDRYDAPAESIGDLDVVDAADEPAPPPPADEPAAAPDPQPTAAPAYDALVGESAAASAASAFAGLHASFKKPEPAPSAGSNAIPFVSGNTVEAMVAEMLRPMLKDWLDANLPAIVEAEVRKEVERIARSAG